MRRKIVESTTAMAAILLTVLCADAVAVDSVSLELGTGPQTKLVRLGAQWRWDRKWLQSNGSHISGYWDLSIDHWQARRFQNNPGVKQGINVVGITPVFRWQSDSLLGFYGEAGIGAHFLSELYDNDGKQLSTRFQFGDHIGFGYVFSSKLDLGVKIQHFSNGGIKEPNNGVNFAIVRASYTF